MTQLHRVRFGALIVAILLVLAACGNGASSQAASSSAQPESAGPSLAASESAEASASESAGAAIDLGGAVDAVSDLTSYQIDITVSTGDDEQVMSVLATKSPDATHYTMGDVELISIDGEGAWIKQGDAWVEAPGGAASFASLFDALAPDTLIASYGLGAWGSGFEDQGSETRNDVETTHYHLDASTVGALGGEFPDDGTFDIWVADEGYLVAMEYGGTDATTGVRSEVSIEVSRVNDSSISIEAPM